MPPTLKEKLEEGAKVIRKSGKAETGLVIATKCDCASRNRAFYQNQFSSEVPFTYTECQAHKGCVQVRWAGTYSKATWVKASTVVPATTELVAQRKRANRIKYLSSQISMCLRDIEVTKGLMTKNSINERLMAQYRDDLKRYESALAIHQASLTSLQ